ncbi:SURF1 family cytochrome oxidase biogenesis protein [Sphingomonas sp.]|jgi:surfeit locus 1 family protein|uniref:SURF1 family cytochrome oxidase biogenesis protein n=1 Tax=Sphingomonas sp. TaxID=28214 RepID=UPI002D7FA588|nr:SURF1 family cytochrome oxidase biogenesis protein [Sphingomonas sp.]HEU0045704.1 SURF1 family cytochrome oxidase biogenesis protein [Sphingomonas sp.]
MRRIPILPTIVVTLAIATMIALGLWQLLDRLPRKEAFLAQLAANPTLPKVAFPTKSDEALLFRRSAARCVPPVAISLVGAGGSGYRAIARCNAGGEPLVQLGTTRDAKTQVRWAGGAVSGFIGQAPDTRSMLAGLWDKTPAPPMLVADPPVAGLAPNRAPGVESLPNNHLAYAGQWFFFALVAAIIYALALRRRPTASG